MATKKSLLRRTLRGAAFFGSEFGVTLIVMVAVWLIIMVISANAYAYQPYEKPKPVALAECILVDGEVFYCRLK